MEISFSLPHVFSSSSSSLEDAYVLRVLLDALVKVNLGYIRTHRPANLYSSGVRYGRTKVWEPIPALYARRFGDCKSLSAVRIAELTLGGVQAQPVFRWMRRPDGGKDFHILVLTAAGYEDPSRKLGMGSNEVAKFSE